MLRNHLFWSVFACAMLDTPTPSRARACSPSLTWCAPHNPTNGRVHELQAGGVTDTALPAEATANSSHVAVAHEIQQFMQQPLPPVRAPVAAAAGGGGNSRAGMTAVRLKPLTATDGPDTARGGGGGGGDRARGSGRRSRRPTARSRASTAGAGRTAATSTAATAGGSSNARQGADGQQYTTPQGGEQQQQQQQRRRRRPGPRMRSRAVRGRGDGAVQPMGRSAGSGDTTLPASDVNDVGDGGGGGGGGGARVAWSSRPSSQHEMAGGVGGGEVRRQRHRRHRRARSSRFGGDQEDGLEGSVLDSAESHV